MHSQTPFFRHWNPALGTSNPPRSFTYLFCHTTFFVYIFNPLYIFYPFYILHPFSSLIYLEFSFFCPKEPGQKGNALCLDYENDLNVHNQNHVAGSILMHIHLNIRGKRKGLNIKKIIITTLAKWTEQGVSLNLFSWQLMEVHSIFIGSASPHICPPVVSSNGAISPQTVSLIVISHCHCCHCWSQIYHFLLIVKGSEYEFVFGKVLHY